ncbi:MAG: hypothetical protein HRT88_18330 [Lentisphaeraceae bacterium]|nr:hypothetical protein [Lentisphaeraceae bacterium]
MKEEEKIKQGAPKKNTNAMKGSEPATAMIKFRCTPSAKAKYEAAAVAAGSKNLSAFIIELLEKNC